MRLPRFIALGMVAAFAASPVLAQEDILQQQGVVVQAFGGVYGHARNLAENPVAHFDAGYGIGGAIGYQINSYLAVNGEFTYARTDGIGVPFEAVNRFVYGGTIEGRLPLSFGLTPFLYAGGGGVTLDETGIAMANWTKPAAFFGAGVGYILTPLPLELTLQARGLAFQWDRNGYDETMVDVVFTAGLRYRFAF